MITLIGDDLTFYGDRFRFQMDANYDGAVTISDIGILFKKVFLLPGDLLEYFITKNYQLELFKFFEVSYIPTYGNVFSWIFSIFIWLIVFSIISSISNDY